VYVCVCVCVCVCLCLSHAHASNRAPFPTVYMPNGTGSNVVRMEKAGVSVWGLTRGLIVSPCFHDPCCCGVRHGPSRGARSTVSGGVNRGALARVPFLKRVITLKSMGTKSGIKLKSALRNQFTFTPPNSKPPNTTQPCPS